MVMRARPSGTVPYSGAVVFICRDDVADHAGWFTTVREHEQLRKPARGRHPAGAASRLEVRLL